MSLISFNDRCLEVGHLRSGIIIVKFSVDLFLELLYSIELGLFLWLAGNLLLRRNLNSLFSLSTQCLYEIAAGWEASERCYPRGHLLSDSLENGLFKIFALKNKQF